MGREVSTKVDRQVTVSHLCVRKEGPCDLFEALRQLCQALFGHPTEVSELVEKVRTRHAEGAFQLREEILQIPWLIDWWLLQVGACRLRSLLLELD